MSSKGKGCFMNLDTIVGRQAEYFEHDAMEYSSLPLSMDLKLPKHNRYGICNLRGGIGKTTLSFNLTYDAGNVLTVDTCPQGNSSRFFTSGNEPKGTTIYDALLPYLLPRMSFPSNIAQKIEYTNSYFEGKDGYFVPSSPDLYEFPSIMENALSQARIIPGNEPEKYVLPILNSFKDLLDRETKKINVKKVLVDTSPFFSGATHLAWHAVDSLVVPVRTDQQSIDSLVLLINILKNKNRSFLKNKSDIHELTIPKIQMVVITHCGWSTSKYAEHEPNKQTRIYIEKVKKVVSENLDVFTTENADNHIVLLNDFLGSGRISSAKQIPIKALNSLEWFTIGEEKVQVNKAIDKCKRQLSFISKNLWG